MDNAHVNKNLYKLFISIIKFIPNILALIQILGLILNCMGQTSFILTCFGGTSFITLLLLYLISYVFKFCGIHRMSLHYVTLITIVTILDFYFNLFLAITAYRIYLLFTGVFITSWIITWYKNRNNPKVDYIKQLCETYCGC